MKISMNLNIKSCFQFLILYFTVCPIFLVSCQQRSVEVTEIRGVYGNPKPLWDKGFNLKDLGVNAVFVHSGSINQEMISKVKSEDIKIFAEFAILNGKNYVETHPEAWLERTGSNFGRELFGLLHPSVCSMQSHGLGL